MNPFNLYEIAQVFDEMRQNSSRHDTIGMLDKKTGRCLYIGHVYHLPKLIDEQIDLQKALFIPNNGYGLSGRRWSSEDISRGESATVVREYIPELLPLFQSLEYPIAGKDEESFDNALFDLNDNAGGILPFRYGFFAFVDVCIWCRENQISLLEPQKARAMFVDWHKGFAAHIEYDEEAGIYHGEVVGCAPAVVTFQSKNPGDLQKEFRTSVDAYLEYCQAKNINPYPYDT